MQAELGRLDSRQTELAGAGRAYTDALAAKERYLTSSADPRGARLLALAEERGRRTAELDELHRASDDADAAAHALAEVRDRLGTAAGWSTFDTYLDHSMVANAVKHDRIDQAAQAARGADQLLARLRSDVSDLGRLEPTAPTLEIGAGFRFADVFFNNIFTDLAVGQQIRDAQGNVDRSAQQVRSAAGPAHGAGRRGLRAAGGYGRGAGPAACAVRWTALGGDRDAEEVRAVHQGDDRPRGEQEEAGAIAGRRGRSRGRWRRVRARPPSQCRPQVTAAAAGKEKAQ